MRTMRALPLVWILVLGACTTVPEDTAPAYQPPERERFVLPLPVEQRSCLAGIEYETTHATLPRTISETGCFTDPAALLPASDMVPYGVQSALWTDGAVKDRFFVLPPGKTIEWGAASRWIVPEGTILVKNFAFALSGTADQLTSVETRFMLKTYQGWRFFNYSWNADGTDGTLVHEHTKPSYAVVQTDGSVQAQDYLVPNAQECAFCHSPATPGELAFKPLQQNGSFAYAGTTRNQLEALIEAGYLAALDLDTVPYMHPITAGTATIEQQARAYMEANCAHCHRPNGFTSTDLTMDLRYEVPLAQTGLCDEVQFFAPPGTVRIAPGNPADSYVTYRMGTRGIDRMPPLGTEVTDPTGLSHITDWIRSLNSCP